MPQEPNLLDRVLRALGINPIRLRWRLRAFKERQQRAANVAENRGRALTYAHQVCPGCQRPADRGEKLCPNCGRQLEGARMQKVRRLAAAVIPADFPIWTVVTLAACAGLFLVTLQATAELHDGKIGTKPDIKVLLHYGATAGWLELGARQWWRMVTAMYLHGGLLHLAMNGFALWTAGTVVEEYFGRGPFLLVYFLTGVAGYATSLWRNGDMDLSVGASGAIFGLIGFVVGHVLRHRRRARELRERFVPWLIYGVVFSFMPGINWLAHFGGGACGILLGLVIADKRTARRIVPSWGWTIIGALVIAATVAAFVLAVQAPPVQM